MIKTSCIIKGNLHLLLLISLINSLPTVENLFFMFFQTRMNAKGDHLMSGEVNSSQWQHIMTHFNF